MKKLILNILLLAGMAGNAVIAQSSYYWYRGQKVPLTKNETKKFVLYSSSSSQRQATSVFERLGAKVGTTGTHSVSAAIAPYKSSKGLHGSWAIIQSQHAIAAATASDEIAYEAPFYVSSDKIEAGVSNLFYVKLKSPADLAALEKLAARNNVEIVGSNKFMPQWYTLSSTKHSKGNALELANLFYESGLFAEAAPAFIHGNIEACVNDPLFPSQWALNNNGSVGTAGVDINACDAWTVTTGNPNIVVAVLDHGIQLNHPDINNLVPQSYDTPTGTSPSIIRGDHGTACAGIIGATRNNSLGVASVAPNASLMSISDPLYVTPNAPQELADGINFAWNNGAAVISNSWGHDLLASPIIDDAITNALTLGRNGLGTIVVFAAGNNDGTIIYPASSNPDILAVGAASPCGTRKSTFSCDNETWWGSCFGSQLDVIAPGVLIPTTDRTGANGYSSGDYAPTFNGTSAATPHVAGVAALILSVNPNLTRKQVADIIESTAQKTGGYSYANVSGRPNGTWHQEAGYGLLDAHAAVVKAQAGNTNYLTKFSVPRATALPTFFKQSSKVHVLGTGGPNLSGVFNSIFNWNAGNSQLVQFTLERNGAPYYTELKNFSTHTFNQAQPKIVINNNTGYAGLAGTYFVNIHNNNLVLVAQNGSYALYFSNSSTPPSVRLEELAGSTEAAAQDEELAALAYPNPFASSTKIVLKEQSSVIVVNTNGEVVDKIEAADQVEIGANYKAGLYLVKVVAGSKVQRFSIVKE